MKTDRADLVVIGAGSGGLSVAAGAAQLGLSVVLFEKGAMGGDCLNTGCVPSKALIAAGARAQAMRDAARFGLTAVEPHVDWPAVRAHVKGVIETIAPIDSQERFEGLGVRVVREYARFEDVRTVVSESARVRARRIVIATGGRAFVPPIPGLAETTFHTNESIFDIPALPRRLVVLGAGPIGIELGQAFARLGSEVVILEADRALGRSDPEAAAVVLARLRAEGVDVREGAKAVGVSGAAGAIVVTLADGTSVSGSDLLVAIGRRPVVDGLDLEAADIAFDARGVKTDAGLRTSNPRVWAVGDVAGREQLTHAAGWHASVFVRNALFKARARADGLPIPAAAYCDPELAEIGLSEAAARARFGDKIQVARWSLHENDRAQAERDAEGVMKLVIGKGGRILGATIVGHGAGDQIQLVALAMSNGLKARALTNLVSPYPTRGEIVKRAAGALFTPLLFSPGVRRLVSFLQRIP